MITPELLQALQTTYQSDPRNRIRSHAIAKVGVNDASENALENAQHPLTFSIELETGDITSQNHSGRCWLFAALNTFRVEIIRRLNLKTFELSQTWAMFWDKLERANYFLENILDTLHEPLDGREVAFLLTDPMGDGGQWDMFCALIDKYGIVPKAQMPETFHSSNSGMMNTLLTRKLREQAIELREAGISKESLQVRKEAMLSEIYNMLCLCLGEPPTQFDFAWRDESKTYHSDPGITPKEFFDKYVGLHLDDFVSIINAPTVDKPYYRTFTVQYLGNVRGGRSVKYLNLPVDEQKSLAVAQLKDNQPVWFGCDVGKMLDRKNGLMGMNTYDYEALLGVSFPMTKAQRLDYHESVMTHAMVLLGVNLVDEKPTRWKVENSWGEDSGQKGFYVMTDDWFSEYNYQIVVHKKYLSPEQLQAWELDPIQLKPWDPMGSLA